MPFQVTVTHEIPDNTIRDLLCCAFEGGSNYWYENAAPVLAEGYTLNDFREGGRMQPKNADGTEEYYHWTQLLPLVEGCAVTLNADDQPKRLLRLDRSALERGLTLMPPRHMHAVLDGNFDAETGDVFLQLCLFGEVVYS